MSGAGEGAMHGTRREGGARFEPLDFPALRPGSASSGLFDAVFEECEAGVFILDLDLDRLLLRIADVNPVALAWLACERSALVGENFLNLVDGDPAQDNIRRLRQAAARHQSVHVRLALRGGNGAGLVGTLSLRPIGRDPQHPRMVAIFRRGSESLHEALIAAQRERDAAREARERILARMSHELRTPLNGILGFAELIGATPADQADLARYRDYAQDISAAGRELLMRVEDLLTAADVPAADEERRPAAVDIGAAFERALRVARMALRRRGLRFDLTVAPGLPRLRGDADDLGRLFDAVIDFAIRGAPPMSVIEGAIRRASDGGLIVQVEDEGALLSAEEVETATLSTDDGRDVYISDETRSCAGLPMARALAERYGGRLFLGAAADGVRSRCVVAFPAERLCA